MTTWELGVLKIYRARTRVEGAIWRGPHVQAGGLLNVGHLLEPFLEDLDHQGWELVSENIAGPEAGQMTESIFRRPRS